MASRTASPLAIVVALCLIGATGVDGAAVRRGQGPTASTPAAWLAAAADAMGGEAALRAISAVEVSGVSVWYQREQSERPEGPWLTSFTDFTDVRNVAAGAVKRTSRARGFSTPDWVDNQEWTAPTRILVASGVALSHDNGGAFEPAGTPPELAILPVALAPEHLVLAALAARDLRAESDETMDGYAHHVVSFTLDDARVRLILNVPSMLPKAVEITRADPYDIFWAPWGDVTHRIAFGVWTLEPNGVRYPRLWEFSTAGQPDGTLDITRVRMNPPVDPGGFVLPADVRQRFVAGRRRVADIPFGSATRPARELAPGIVKVPGSWDIAEVRMDDGVVIVEGPLSSEYSVKAIADAQQRFPGAPITAVVSTSDAWPHIGGLREYAARGIPIYALDLNVPILGRLLAARYESSPDALAQHSRRADIRIVAGKATIGTGPNRIDIYPFRTATGERQMMLYWPAHQLLYTSDLFTIRGDFVFLPQQVSEAVDAATRLGLPVTTAFGMHYDALPWPTVVKNAAPPRRTRQ